MLTYQVPAAILGPLCPAGVCLDLHHDTALVSVVGFRFLNTRLFHIPIPFHRNFDEVNLRFYVRREMPDGEIRRGVCFVRELVPRRSIASIARRAYQEPYIAVAMRSTAPSELVNSPGRISYSWQWSGKWDHVAATAVGSPAEPADPLAAFVTDHYWGYTRQRRRQHNRISRHSSPMANLARGISGTLCQRRGVVWPIVRRISEEAPRVGDRRRRLACHSPSAAANRPLKPHLNKSANPPAPASAAPAAQTSAWNSASLPLFPLREVCRR